MRLTAKALLCQTLVRYTFGSPPVNLFIRSLFVGICGRMPAIPFLATRPLPLLQPVSRAQSRLARVWRAPRKLKREWVGDPLLILLFFSSFGVPRARFLNLGLRVSILSPFSFLPSLPPRRLISGKLTDPVRTYRQKLFRPAVRSRDYSGRRKRSFVQYLDSLKIGTRRTARTCGGT